MLLKLLVIKLFFIIYINAKKYDYCLNMIGNDEESLIDITEKECPNFYKEYNKFIKDCNNNKICVDEVIRDCDGLRDQCKLQEPKKDCPYEDKYALCLNNIRIGTYCSINECNAGFELAKSGAEMYGEDGIHKVDNVIESVKCLHREWCDVSNW